MRYLIFFITASLIIACSGKEKIPEEVMKPEKMTLVMLDIMRAGGLAEQNMRRLNDSLVKAEEYNARFYKQVFNIHKITKDEFFKSYNYYKAHPDVFKIVIDSVNAINERTKYEIYQRDPTKRNPK